MIVAPADGLAPPLLCELVREKKLRVAGKGRRIVSPDQLRVRQRLVERGEVAGAVAAGQIVFHERHGEARVRTVAEQRLVEGRDVRCAFRQFAAVDHLPRIRFDRQVQASIRLSDRADRIGRRGRGVAARLGRRTRLGERREADGRRFRPHEARDDEGEVADGPRGGEDVDLAVLRGVGSGQQSREARLQLAARDALDRRGDGDSDARGRVVADRRLRAP